MGIKVREKIIVTDLISLNFEDSIWWIWFLSAIKGLCPLTNLLQNNLIKSKPGIIIKITISSTDISDSFIFDLIINAEIKKDKKYEPQLPKKILPLKL